MAHRQALRAAAAALGAGSQACETALKRCIAASYRVYLPVEKGS